MEGIEMNDEWRTKVEEITEHMIEVLLCDIHDMRFTLCYTPTLETRLVELIEVTPTWDIIIRWDSDYQTHLVDVLNYLHHNGFEFMLTEEGGVYNVRASKPNLKTSY